MLSDSVKELVDKYGKEVAKEFGDAFLSEMEVWMNEYQVTAMLEAAHESIENRTLDELLKVKGALSAIEVIKESVWHAFGCAEKST